MALHQADTVGEKMQRPLSGYLGIQLAQGTGGGVPRIGEGGLPGLFSAAIEFFEVLDFDVGLTPHFQS